MAVYPSPIDEGGLAVFLPSMRVQVWILPHLSLFSSRTGVVSLDTAGEACTSWDGDFPCSSDVPSEGI